jgi:hypothetical protein
MTLNVEKSNLLFENKSMLREQNAQAYYIYIIINAISPLMQLD